jgi:hypothetical protein
MYAAASLKTASLNVGYKSKERVNYSLAYS